MRRKKGVTPEARAEELRTSKIFEEVRDRFDALVRTVEADLSVPIAIEELAAQVRAVDPGDDPHFRLRCVLHAAADVAFSMPLQRALVSVANGSLQMLELAAVLKCRFVFVSTAFVQPKPITAAHCAELPDLCGLRAADLYRCVTTM